MSILIADGDRVALLLPGTDLHKRGNEGAGAVTTPGEAPP